MFSEFSADAALIIQDRDKFKERLKAAVSQQQPAALEMQSGPLKYYDPYTVERNELIPIFSKNLSYWYQNEFRFAWKAEESEKLAPFFVDVGSLADIATLLEIA
jgi:hypothetical protein